MIAIGQSVRCTFHYFFSAVNARKQESVSSRDGSCGVCSWPDNRKADHFKGS